MSTNTQQQGKSTTTRKPSTMLTLAEAVAKFGNPDTALSGLQQAAEALQTHTSNVDGWGKVAESYTGTQRKFAEEAGGSKHTLARLLAVGRLRSTSRKAEGVKALSTAEAVKVANVASKATIDGYVADMEKGKDPFAAQRSSTGTVKPGAGRKTRKTAAPVTKVAPDTAADILRAILAVVPNVSKGDTAVEIATLATAVAEAATARAASLRKPVRGQRAAMAS